MAPQINWQEYRIADSDFDQKGLRSKETSIKRPKHQLSNTLPNKIIILSTVKHLCCATARVTHENFFPAYRTFSEKSAFVGR